ncbi:MAG: hypothetical protein F4Z80_07195 [Chloroflexi bacterium]|nr:hypothetical protein [Chloroflexota bacterium]MYC46866.1 hypothetical protein [Chloroflexota bacterium]
MRQTNAAASPLPPSEVVARLDQSLPASGLYGDLESGAKGSRAPFRLSPQPIGVSPATLDRIERLGPLLADFYRAAGRLYQDSVRGNVAGWPAKLLDAGKSEFVISLARRNRLRNRFPLVIRPDLMLTEQGAILATELDSVPGGLGVLQALRDGYSRAGLESVGAPLAESFKSGLVAQAGIGDPFVAIVVSEEGDAYRPELTALAEELCRLGLRCRAVWPNELEFDDAGVWLGAPGRGPKVDLIYRFFELFDLENVPGAESMFKAMQARQVVITPPPRAPLEEKLLLALFHHPELTGFWERQLGDDSFAALRQHLPPTWVIDPTPLPPFAAIDPPLTSAGRPVRRWRDLCGATQRGRRMVIKPSGFSPQAWGSRGVTIGHDVPAPEWGDALEAAMVAFEQSPHVLQPYFASRRFSVQWFDMDQNRLRDSRVRGRFSPYFIDSGEDVQLAGILATACPDSSKILHGMADAVMAPVAQDPESPL